MIKNSHYTFDYFQPEEYHFSLDSVFLAQKVAGLLQDRSDKLRVLDLCAGCGIIGLELSLHSNLKFKMDFLEVQEVYKPFFQKNLEMIYPEETNAGNFRFLNLNYTELLSSSFENHYDLIVCNPPYFFKGEGLLSPNDFKNRCRFFLDSDFKTLVEATLHALIPGGGAYLLVRTGTHHGRSPLEEMNMWLGNSGEAKIIDQVRSTDIVEIRKKLH
ncbi:MAG: methyltransferase [Bacteriovorax sp.]|jgi:tRNA1(Val) A37 N6-methylase TrmN6